VKAIALSEKADVRQWTTLPKSLWLLDLPLEKGDYQIFISDTDKNQEKFAGNISITTDTQEKSFFHMAF
ncbi:MAG: hypothetical protein OXB84_08425, partial [Halobacteriovoraceae bacterium]|nr:hypothetical protein [Halobacteriovoraceae bacterium]